MSQMLHALPSLPTRSSSLTVVFWGHTVHPQPHSLIASSILGRHLRGHHHHSHRRRRWLLLILPLPLRLPLRLPLPHAALALGPGCCCPGRDARGGVHLRLDLPQALALPHAAPDKGEERVVHIGGREDSGPVRVAVVAAAAAVAAEPGARGLGVFQERARELRGAACVYACVCMCVCVCVGAGVDNFGNSTGEAKQSQAKPSQAEPSRALSVRPCAPARTRKRARSRVVASSWQYTSTGTSASRSRTRRDVDVPGPHTSQPAACSVALSCSRCESRGLSASCTSTTTLYSSRASRACLGVCLVDEMAAPVQ
jgi:hypothetical protein